MTPEQQAFHQIDAMLAASGWLIEDCHATDFRSPWHSALVPMKTLIFAKNDSHAADIVHLCPELFGNDFYKNIAYQAKHPVTGKPVKGRELHFEVWESQN